MDETRKILRLCQGFTLVEILVVVLLFGFLFLTGVVIFIQVFQNANRSAIQTEVRQNGNTIVGLIGDSIKRSSCVDWGVCGSDIVIRTYSDACQTLADQYRFAHSDGSVYLVSGAPSAPNPGSCATLTTGVETKISSDRVASLNCGVNSGACSQAPSSVGWVRPDGTATTWQTTNCLVKVYGQNGCRGGPTGFVRCSQTDSCDPLGNGVCFELLNSPSSGSWTSQNSCSSGYCGYFSSSSSCTSVPGSGSMYADVIPLQYVTGFGTSPCSNGAVIGSYNSGGVFIYHPSGFFFPWLYEIGFTGASPGFPNVSLSLTMQNQVGPTRSDFCAATTLTGTFSPRLKP